MNPLDLQLESLVKYLSSEGIRYVILGGVAVSIYGEPRLTADIDVNIILDKEKISYFIKRGKKFGFYPLLSNAKKIAKETGIIPMRFRKKGVTGKFDIIIAENPIEYSAIKKARSKKIDSIKLKIISAEDLIIHKITSSRARDEEDLRGILIRQKGKLDLDYILYWLKKIDEANRKSYLCRLFKGLLRRL